MKPFSVERIYWTLFLKKYASISDKIQQQIISKEGEVIIFLSYCLCIRISYWWIIDIYHPFYLYCDLSDLLGKESENWKPLLQSDIWS